MADLTLEHVNSSYGPAYIEDVGNRPQLKIFEIGQSAYVAYGNQVTLIRTGAVELSLDRGDIKGYIDAGILAIV